MESVRIVFTHSWSSAEAFAVSSCCTFADMYFELPFCPGAPPGAPSIFNESWAGTSAHLTIMQCATVPSRAVLSTFDAFTHFRCRAHGNGTWVALPDDVFMPEIQSLRNREVARLLHSSGGSNQDPDRRMGKNHFHPVACLTRLTNESAASLPYHFRRIMAIVLLALKDPCQKA